MAFVFLYLINAIAMAIQRKNETVSVNEFVQLIEQNKLAKMQIDGVQVVAERRDNGAKVRTTAHHTMDLIMAALEADSADGETVALVEKEPSDGMGAIFWILYLGISIAILYFLFTFMRGRAGGGGGGGGGLFGGITKHKAVRMDGKSGKTFADVGGIDEVRDEVMEVVDFLKNPHRYAALGGRPPKGTLLMGPPGVGKTLLAQAVAGEAGVPFFSVSGSEFDEMFVGVGSARIRSLREEAEKSAPCIVYVDEIDSLGRKRGAAFSGGDQEKQNTLNQFLQFVDGIDASTGIVFMGATNQPEQLDPALMRPGRFDRQIHVPPPDVNGRIKILEIHVRRNRVPLAEDVSLAKVASATPGMSGAELENLVNEAALVAGRRGLTAVDSSCFSEAADKVQMGLARKSMVLSEEDKSIICVHEIGHALVGWFNPDGDPVRKVTCIPRGPGLGMTIFAPEDDRYLPSKDYLLADIDRSLGGRVAEEIVVGKITAGASNDLAVVRRIARAMVTRFAMTDLGQMALGQNYSGYLGQSEHHADYSEQTAEAIDSRMKEIVDRSYERVNSFISEKKEMLVAAAKVLYEKETLEEADLIELFGERPKRDKIYKLK
jgi:cell division protease FtsH